MVDHYPTHEYASRESSPSSERTPSLASSSRTASPSPFVVTAPASNYITVVSHTVVVAGVYIPDAKQDEKKPEQHAHLAISIMVRSCPVRLRLYIHLLPSIQASAKHTTSPALDAVPSFTIPEATASNETLDHPVVAARPNSLSPSPEAKAQSAHPYTLRKKRGKKRSHQQAFSEDKENGEPQGALDGPVAGPSTATREHPAKRMTADNVLQCVYICEDAPAVCGLDQGACTHALVGPRDDARHLNESHLASDGDGRKHCSWPACSATYAKADGLTQHVKEKHWGWRFVCEACGSVFGRHDVRRTHQKKCAKFKAL